MLAVKKRRVFVLDAETADLLKKISLENFRSPQKQIAFWMGQYLAEKKKQNNNKVEEVTNSKELSAQEYCEDNKDNILKSLKEFENGNFKTCKTVQELLNGISIQ